MKKKSQFLSAFGKTFQIFKSLTDAVMDAGGSDEDVGRILVDEKLRKELAARIMMSRNRPIEGMETLDDTIALLEQEKELQEKPKREREMKMEEEIQKLLAWTTSEEAKKAARLLDLGRGRLKSIPPHELDKHGFHRSLPNTYIPTDYESCSEQIKWWCQTHYLGPAGYIEFLKQQVNLAAEFLKSPQK